MGDIYKKQISRNKILVICALILLIISPIIAGINFFYYPFENLFLSFLGIVFFDGFELSLISFTCGILIIIYQLIMIVFASKNSYDYDEAEKKISADEIITENDLQTSIDPNVDTNEQTVINSFEQIDDFIGQLDLVLKKSRHDVFNLMLDPNGINSPDDFQSAVESLELALSSLRAIKKQIIEMKRDV